jgi:hypothetical protein
MERHMSEHPESAPSAVEDPGLSTTKSGEETGADEDEAGREDLGTKGESERPVGTSTARDSTGVDPKEPITGGPTQIAGDQGG